MKAAMAPFGVEKDKLEVVLFQLVRSTGMERSPACSRERESQFPEDLLEEWDDVHAFSTLKTSKPSILIWILQSVVQ